MCEKVKAKMSRMVKVGTRALRKGTFWAEGPSHRNIHELGAWNLQLVEGSKDQLLHALNTSKASLYQGIQNLDPLPYPEAPK